MTENVELKTLLAAQQTGRPEQFRAIYDLLVDKLYAYVNYRVGTKEIATDLVQDIFIDLYHALPKFTYNSDAQFYSFVFLIAKRKLAKHYTESKNKQALEIATDVDTLSANLSNVADEDMVRRALDKLEPETREIIVLHHWSRYTFKEIALMLDLTESATRVRHHRALETLSTLLAKT